MTLKEPLSQNARGISIGAILRGLCPACHRGEIYRAAFVIHPSCSECGYDFYPENGFYLGAMSIGFLVAAMSTVPPVIALKLLGVDNSIVIFYPLAQFVVTAPLLLFYVRIFWLHLEYRMTRGLERRR